MRNLKSLAVVGSAVLSSASFAAVDTTAVVAEISGNSAAIIAVGGALLALAAVAVGIKWVKATIFG